ncbi:MULTISPECIES: BCCT family transporter [Citromicrobium]|uniref:BCCT family transporter n=2 Tax=Sphingomonadaceae TaxID=41297 RepID=UPI000A9A4898|nr:MULTISPECIES: BCCT family transporter [Citromicrobium]
MVSPQDDAARRRMGLPLFRLPIFTAESGFYRGFNTRVAIPGKLAIALLIGWTLLFPDAASHALTVANETIIAAFAGWYVYLVAFLTLVALVLAILPQSGTLRLGAPGEKPEFGAFSWFAMLFGAGIGIGLLTYSTGEPLAHFQSNPETIRGLVEPVSAANVRPSYVYTFFHWGFAAWSTYALVGLAVGYVSYRRGLPLTIRSALTPLFGERMSGFAGHTVDFVAVVATILGVAVTLGLGVQQFVAGLDRLGMGDWLMLADGSASAMAIILAVIFLLGASTLSALSGVGAGIRWLSNLNLGLSFVLLAIFLVFGAGVFGLESLGLGLIDYVVALPSLALMVLSPDGTPTGDALAQWQLDWSVFYWAWWIAFAPFVGMFIARVSRGRTVREFVLGVVLVPSLMGFVWMTLIGGTAIELELSGAADGSILDASISDQLYATLSVMLSAPFATLVSILVVVLLMTYLVTSADSAILIVNTINAAGEDDNTRRRHVLFWGVAIGLVVASMLILGGIDALQTTMIIGALPFSVVVVLMTIALIKAILFDVMRKRQGVATHSDAVLEEHAKLAE